MVAGGLSEQKYCRLLLRWQCITGEMGGPLQTGVGD